MMVPVISTEVMLCITQWRNLVSMQFVLHVSRSLDSALKGFARDDRWRVRNNSNGHIVTFRR